MLKRLISSLVVWLLICAVPGQTGEYDILWEEFDARPLTQDEKRLLQAGLAFEGLYQGLLDGKWGRISQRALERYSERETDSPAANYHMAGLMFGLAELVEQDGWDFLHLDHLNISLLFPFETAVENEPLGTFASWQHTRSSLALSMGMADQDDTSGFHEHVISLNDQDSRPYTVRKPGLAVTSSESRDGTLLYLRSDYTRGAWTTVFLGARAEDGNLLNAVAGSITVGSPPPMELPEGGLLDRVIDLAVALVDESDDTVTGSGDASSRISRDDETTRGGTGSAFVVSDHGHLLTNAHVVEGCRAITVNGLDATVLETSTLFDLALIQSIRLSGGQAAAFAQQPASLNLDIVVAGYPLGGILGGLNITRGTVSALKGLEGSESTMQISAPVQQGNSGGPVLAADGSVVGVVVSKLDAVAMADLTGDIPQNVNFAVRGELAKLFLFQNGVAPKVAGTGISLDPVELGRRAQSFTYLVECVH